MTIFIRNNTLARLVQCSLIALLLSCKNKTAENKPAEKEAAHTDLSVTLTPEQFKTAGIQTDSISYRVLSGTIKVNGLLDVPPQQTVSVSAPLGGFMQSSDMLQGKYVQKGALIATLQDPAYIQMQQDYLDNSSQLEYLQAEYLRQQELAAENINARKTLQLAKANYESMRARVAGLKARMRLINIDIARLEKGHIQNTISLYAPISGFVTEVNVNTGQYINPTDILFRIVDTRHVHAELTVFEKDIAAIRTGQKVRFYLSNETKERTATVYLVGREISKDRTIRIHCHLDEEDTNLLPGMYLTAYVETSHLSQPALPGTAVLDYEGKKYVFTEDSTAHNTQAYRYTMVQVNTGATEAGYTAVELPGNTDKKRLNVVVKGAYDLLSKLKNNEAEE